MIERIVDTESGEVMDLEPIELVALDMAALDEDAMLALFPTYTQAAGALILAREAVRRAPMALREARQQLRRAEQDHRITLGKVTKELASEFVGYGITERRTMAHADKRVAEAQDTVDTMWIALEYAKDWDVALNRDVKLLISINANFREVHK